MRTAGKWCVVVILIIKTNTDSGQNIHCIGDRANHVVLDIFENIFLDDNITDSRPRIEHAQIMTLDDLERVGRLGGAFFLQLFSL